MARLEEMETTMDRINWSPKWVDIDDMRFPYLPIFYKTVSELSPVDHIVRPATQWGDVLVFPIENDTPHR